MQTDKNLCANCQQPLYGEICANCGQLNTGAIETKRVASDIWSQFMELDFRVVRVVKELFTRPGLMINDYLKGKRVLYTNPFKLLFFSATAYFLIIKYFDINVGGTDETNKQTGFLIAALLNYFIFIILIPTAFFFRLIYAKKTLNWAESYVAICYIWSGYLILCIPVAVTAYYSGINFILLRTIFALIYIYYATKSMFDINAMPAAFKATLLFIIYFIISILTVGLAITLAHLFGFEPVLENV